MSGMDILGKARRLESRIAGALDKYAKDFVRSPGGREPLEIVHAVLDAVEQQVHSGGRGTRVFPFNRIDVSIAAPTPEARARFQSLLEGDAPLADRIAERLRAAGSAPPPDLAVAVAYPERAQDSWRAPEFHVEFARVEAPVAAAPETPAAAPAAPDRLEITILRGVADQRTYSFSAVRVDLGRCAEVRDSRNRLVRTNHVAFTEGSGEVNETVSRRHAHIACEPPSGQFRLYDDGSEHGTGIVRDGRTVPVPRGARGVRLQPGDEIVLGEARVKVRYDATRTPRRP